MEVTIGIIIIVVFLVIVRQQIRIRRPASDTIKNEAEALINQWAQERRYLVLHKSFTERQWGPEKRLFYEVYIRDAEGKERRGVAVCVMSDENPNRNRVDIVWKHGED
jgi:hypothetical protein